MKKTDSGKHKTPEDPLIGQLVAGKWRVSGRLDDAERPGAYRVERVPTGEAACLIVGEESQVIPRGELARFDREARIAGQIKHPRVAKILDFGAWRERPYLVSEPLKGKRLSDVIGTDEMTVRRAVAITAQLLEVARHLHAYGVVHRDLKPEGVVLVDSPTGDQVKLAPPELGLRGAGLAERRGDHGRDLLAIGRMLYAMCVGRAAGVDGAIEPPRRAAPAREIGEGLEGVILKATASRPDVRFQSAEDFLNALTAAEGTLRPVRAVRRPRRASSPAIVGATGKSLPKVKIAWGVAVLVAIAGTGIVINSARTGRRAEPVEEATPVASEQPTQEARRLDVPSRAQIPRVAAPAPVPVAPLPSVALPKPEPIVEKTPPPQAASVRMVPLPKASSPKVTAQVEPKAPAVPMPVSPTPARVAPKQAIRLASGPVGANVQAAAAVPLVPITDGERAEVLQLIAVRDSAHANEKITALMQRDPRVAWPHVALAELHFRNLWRRDVVRQWQIALYLDPALKEDPRLARHLCLARDAKWEAAGIGELRAALGEQATAALLAGCAPATVAVPAPRGDDGSAVERRGDDGDGGDGTPPSGP